MVRRICIMILVVGVFSCSKRTHPSQTSRVIYDAENTGVSKEKSEKAAPSKVAVSPKKEFPQTIYVNDKAASKSVDGRLYYDVKGHRYWKNYKDGKYYLFNKSMYSNPDFKPPTGNGG